MTATINLFRHAEEAESLAAGQIVFSAGDPGTVMYVVTEGEVEIRMENDLVDLVGPGGIFGELAILDSAPRSATAVARCDSKVVAVSDKRFMFLVQQTPQFALQVMRIMSERLKRRGSIRAPQG